MTLRQVVISVPMQQSGQGLGSAWRRVEMDWTIGLEGIFIWFPWSRNTQLNWHNWQNWQIEFKIFSNFESCKYYFLQCRCCVEAWSVFDLAAWCVVFWSLNHFFMFSVSCCFFLWAAMQGRSGAFFFLKANVESTACLHCKSGSSRQLSRPARRMESYYQMMCEA